VQVIYLLLQQCLFTSLCTAQAKAQRKNFHYFYPTYISKEHLSIGEFDEDGKGPEPVFIDPDCGSDEGPEVRLGYRCHHYDENDEKFTTPYEWK